jgi:hypothetical protein
VNKIVQRARELTATQFLVNGRLKTFDERFGVLDVETVLLAEFADADPDEVSQIVGTMSLDAELDSNVEQADATSNRH